MRRWVTVAAGVLAVGLGGCVSYHQQAGAVRMPRPKGLDPTIAGYAAPDPAYPSVGGDILKDTSPRTQAPDDATTGEPVSTPPGPDSPLLRRRIAHALATVPS
jgi:hypothetical protein